MKGVIILTFYLNYEELIKCAQVYKQHFPEQAENTMEIADQSIKSQFMIPETMAADRWVDLGNPINWLFNPTEDPEFTWILNRHEHMINLGKAYLLTGKEIYVEIFMKHIIGWIHQNPVPSNITYEAATFFQKRGPWRLLEVGLRVQAWCWAYMLMQRSRSLSKDFLEKFFYSLSEHADYLCEYLGDTEINHATMHMQGLFMVGVVNAEHSRSAYWRQVAVERLELCLLHQIDKDGVQVELSTHYHNYSIIFFGTSYVLAEKTGYKMSNWYREKLKSIATFTEAAIRPDGISSPISDSNWSEEAKELLGFIGLAIEDEHYLGVGNFTETMLWMFGADAYKKYKNSMGSKGLSSHSTSFPTAGYYIMRDERQYLFFDAAQMGGAHGHADILNFEWMWKNQLIFSDLGCYTYEEGDWRKYFKSTKNHNTIAVDDMDQTPYLLSQKWGEPVAKPKLFRVLNNELYYFIDASHDGYHRLEQPVDHRRWVMQLKSYDLLIIVDWVEGKGMHKIQQHFNLSEDALIEIKDNTAEIKYTSSKVEMTMQWWGGNDDKDNIIVLKDIGWISKKYAFKDEIPVINANLLFKDETCIVTICKPFYQCKSKNDMVSIEKVQIDNIAKVIDIWISYNEIMKSVCITPNSILLKDE